MKDNQSTTISHNQQQEEDDEFDKGLTITQLIDELENIKNQYGNIRVGTYKRAGEWYGVQNPEITKVDKNLYKGCYVVGSEVTIVTL